MESSAINKRNKNLPILMLSSGLSIGIGLGVSLGVAFGNIPVGLSVGAGVGISIGVVLYNYFSSKTCSKNNSTAEH